MLQTSRGMLLLTAVTRFGHTMLINRTTCVLRVGLGQDQAGCTIDADYHNLCGSRLTAQTNLSVLRNTCRF